MFTSYVCISIIFLGHKMKGDDYGCVDVVLL